MKRVIFYTTILSFFSFAALASTTSDDYSNPKYPHQKPLPSIHNIEVKQAPENGFFFKPFLSLEYSAPRISGGGINSQLRTNNFGKQMTHFENIAVGFNFRVHRYLGFNANWQKTDLTNDVLQGIGSLSQEARFKMNHYNFSALFYGPRIENFLETFLEAGVADMNSKLTYVQSNGVVGDRKAHETMGIYGVGFQLLVNPDNIVRFSIQKYSGKLALIDSYYTTIRVGYLRSF